MSKDLRDGPSLEKPTTTSFQETTAEMRHQQAARFRQRDNEHRSFIRAYLFDLIFKTFVSILDECLSQRDRLLA